MIETLIYVITGAITLIFPIVYVLRDRKESRIAKEHLETSRALGQEPVSLHPVINPDICIGSGSCVKACPEVDVLGMIEGKSNLINPSHCIGHGMCQAACPVDAITLVFGSEKRGVDIPHIKGNFETNIPGIFIAGELGGMGLIRNAVTQGRQAAQAIAQKVKGKCDETVLDLVIVGAGPAGISASLQARKEGLNFVTLDQEEFGGTIYTYPRRKLVMTQPMELPLYGVVKAREIEKEPLMKILTEAVTSHELPIRPKEKVNDILRENGHFKVKTPDTEYTAQNVLLAVGRRGTPRKIGCPGEMSDKVAYRLIDAEQFQAMRVLVVGGGDSAVEAALALAQQPGNTVHLSYRGDSIFRIKPGNRTRLDTAMAEGKVAVLLNSNVTLIEPQRVCLEQQGKEIILGNDQVFVLIGGELPIEFLKKIGIEFERKFGTR